MEQVDEKPSNCVNSPTPANTETQRLLTNPLSTTIDKDSKGNEHMRMNFHVRHYLLRGPFDRILTPNKPSQVSGPLNDGVVLVHLVKMAGQSDFEYHLLALDVKGKRKD